MENDNLSNMGIDENGNIKWNTTKSSIEPTGFIGIGTTEPSNNKEEWAIEFKNSNEPVIQISKDGKIYIRGEFVTDNVAVYEALLDFLEDSGYLDNWKRNGY